MLPRQTPIGRAALRSVAEAGSLVNLVLGIALLQACCITAPASSMAERGWRSAIVVIGFCCTIAGAIAALPCSSYLARGVGGRKRGPRYVNFEARLSAGVAEQPHLLPRVYVWAAAAAGLAATSELLALLAMVPDLHEFYAFAFFIAVLLIINVGALVRFVVGYRRHASVLRRLPPPLPAPPGALPVKGSLEAVALWFGERSRGACAFAAITGMVGCIGVFAVGVFGLEPAVLASSPVLGFATYACYRGYQGIDAGLRTRDERVQRGLAWGLIGGVAGSLPLALTVALHFGTKLGWFYVDVEAWAPPIRYALGQPGGGCFCLFLLPLLSCGVTLGAFGRELSTRRTAEERIVEAERLDEG